MDTGKDIESTFRLMELQPHGGQAFAHIVPAPPEQLHGGGGAAGQRRDTGLLDKGGDRHDGVLVEQLHPLFHRLVRHAPAEPPAGHGPGLGEAVDDDQPVPHVCKAGEAAVVLCVNKLPVYVVAQNKNRLIPENFMDRVQRFLRVDTAGGIVGGREDQGLGFRRDCSRQLRGSDLKIVGLGGQGHRNAAA